jgi:hypothetical protein
MTCTYFGGSTGLYIRNALAGVVSHPTLEDVYIFAEEDDGIAPRAFAQMQKPAKSQGTPPKIPSTLDTLCRKRAVFFAQGDQVLSNKEAGLTPLFITLDGVTIEQKKHRSRAKSSVNLNFLAQCKLLCMKTFKTALKKHPSPMAMSLACIKAKKSLKPDYGHHRSYGPDVADFIEALIYQELEPSSHPKLSKSFKVGVVTIGSKNDDPRIFLHYPLNFENPWKVPQGFFAEQVNNSLDKNWMATYELLDPAAHNALMEIPSLTSTEVLQHAVRSQFDPDYLAERGLMDRNLYIALEPLCTRAEAVKHAVRKAFNQPSTTSSEIFELPADFSMD